MRLFLLKDSHGYFWYSSPFFGDSLEYSVGLTEDECRQRARKGDEWARRACAEADQDLRVQALTETVYA